jgi:transposase
MGRRSRRGCTSGSTQEWAQFQEVERHLRERKARAVRQLPAVTTSTGQAIAHLQTLRGIGVMGAWVLATELFGWRQIANRRQLGGLVGLVPAPYQSGDTAHDQGITRAGNRHVRRVMVQLAWLWLRHQPQSALAQWYQRRFGGGGKRLRRIGDCGARAQTVNSPLAVLEDRGCARGGPAETGGGLRGRRCGRL